MLLDMSFFIDEIVNVPGSSIEEPDPPAEIMDLTDVTAQQLVLYVLSLPFVVFIQIFDLCVALLKAARRYILRERRKRLEASAAEYDEAANAAAKAAKKRQSGVLSRLVRTLRRCLCCCLRIKGVGGIGGSPSKNKILPGSSGAGGEGGGEEKATRCQIGFRVGRKRIEAAAGWPSGGRLPGESPVSGLLPPDRSVSS
jgi:hypothetical protein